MKTATCVYCGAALFPGEQKCPKCGTPTSVSAPGGREVTCARCGHYPVYIPRGGWGACPKCQKLHM